MRSAALACALLLGASVTAHAATRTVDELLAAKSTDGDVTVEGFYQFAGTGQLFATAADAEGVVKCVGLALRDADIGRLHSPSVRHVRVRGSILPRDELTGTPGTISTIDGRTWPGTYCASPNVIFVESIRVLPD